MTAVIQWIYSPWENVTQYLPKLNLSVPVPRDFTQIFHALPRPAHPSPSVSNTFPSRVLRFKAPALDSRLLCSPPAPASCWCDSGQTVQPALCFRWTNWLAGLPGFILSMCTLGGKVDDTCLPMWVLCWEAQWDSPHNSANQLERTQEILVMIFLPMINLFVFQSIPSSYLPWYFSPDEGEGYIHPDNQGLSLSPYPQLPSSSVTLMVSRWIVGCAVGVCPPHHRLRTFHRWASLTLYPSVWYSALTRSMDIGDLVLNGSREGYHRVPVICVTWCVYFPEGCHLNCSEILRLNRVQQPLSMLLLSAISTHCSQLRFKDIKWKI